MTDEQQRNPSVDLSFPIPEQPVPSPTVREEPQGDDHADRVHHDVHDVVDTNWDIPIIEFPDSAAGNDRTRAVRAVRSQSSRPSTPHAQTDHGGVDGRSDGHHEGGEPELTEALNDLRDAEEPDDARLNPWDDDHDAADGVGGDEFSSIVNHAIGDASDQMHPVPEFTAASSQAVVPQRGHHRRLLVVVVAALVAVALISLAGVWFARQHADRESRFRAVESCRAAMTSYRSADATLAAALRETKAQQGVKTTQVHDVQAVDRLSQAVAQSRSRALNAGQMECDGGSEVTVIEEHARLARAAAPVARASARSIRRYAAAIEADKSRRDAEVSSARDGLNTELNSAIALLENSQYQVADNATRVALESAIAKARQVQADAGATPEALNAVRDELRSSQQSVNDSMSLLTTQRQSTPVYPPTTSTNGIQHSQGNGQSNVRGEGDTGTTTGSGLSDKEDTKNPALQGNAGTSKDSASNQAATPSTQP